MFPIRDDIPTERTPIVNYLVIGACVAVFLAQMNAAEDGSGLIYEYGMVPSRITRPDKPVRRIEMDDPADRQEINAELAEGIPAPPPAVPPLATLVTCIFLHGGLMHLVGNMWFLYIFGDNVEDRFGHGGYLLLYLLCGVIASLGHLVSAPGSEIPTVGASGAIAGVMGAYFVMFHGARVMTLIPLGIFTQLVAVPAPFFLGIWFVFQFISAAMTPAEGGGVAWWAHIGGFVAGVIAAWLLSAQGRVPRGYHRPEVQRAWRRQSFPWN
ncbi:MAG TPA: rhomboid family intramembrane serine protease [Planctomycetaceae bacterium]|jgi:membrane associated rhomboid family serine protease|nr:rhomboid family intramembrane serine protease [Planctomycetaceae bacterium]